MNIFVSCSSSDYIDDKYKELGRKVGKFIGENKHTLVFGSSESGIMGEVYRNTKLYGGKVKAIVPKDAYGVLGKVECDELIEVDKDTDQFFRLVHDNDVAIVLPGSVGTLAELALLIHYNHFLKGSKKVLIVNEYGFFDDMKKMFKKILDENFAYDVGPVLYEFVDSIEEALDKI